MDSLGPWFNSLGEYPRWLVVACVAVVGALVLYLLAKLLKWSFYALAFLVLAGGLGLAAWMLLK
ncbi:MAG: hypothetical protein HZA31_13565 [Opitutae bacterium]|nr:hypothetical protein [Opitutae bacterium]